MLFDVDGKRAKMRKASANILKSVKTGINNQEQLTKLIEDSFADIEDEQKRASSIKKVNSHLEEKVVKKEDKSKDFRSFLVGQKKFAATDDAEQNGKDIEVIIAVKEKVVKEAPTNILENKMEEWE